MSDINESETQSQLNKRLMLNLLIQGAASHTYLTAHHLVGAQLNSIEPGFLPLYDKMALNVHLSQWIGDLVTAIGFPHDFWQCINMPWHPFSGNPFLVKHGEHLADESRLQTEDRARQKGISTRTNVQYAQTFWLLGRTVSKEVRHRTALAELAKQATQMIWGIDTAKLHGVIAGHVEFGDLQIPATTAGLMLRRAAAGYGGVVKEPGGFKVHARAWVWPLLSHELTKGTAELICLHGLNQLTESTYLKVTTEADKIEHEIWMMQAGGALWRRFLAALPSNEKLAESLMHVAMMPPETLEQFMMDLVEHPFTAKATVADFFDEPVEFD